MRSEIVALKTVAQRLDAWLTWHDAIPPKGECRALAFEIAVSPEALYRELGKRKASSRSYPQSARHLRPYALASIPWVPDLRSR